MISECILQGERVRLRPVEERDLPNFVRWLADPEVTRWLGDLEGAPSLEDEQEWYENKRGDPDNVLWAIDGPGGRLIGTIELRVSPRQRRAEMGVAIQDKTQWNQGYGTQAVGLVLDYAFDDLGLNRLQLTCDEDNARAIRCYEKCGFQREGLLRQHRLVEGRFGNTLIMSVLKEDWDAARRPAQSD